MKKLVLVLGVLLTMSGLYADNAKSVEIINKATDDLRGIAVDDEECQKAILSFYTIVAKDSNRSISVTKEYKDCIAKKQNIERIKLEKEREVLNKALQKIDDKLNNLIIGTSDVDFVSSDTNETADLKG